MSMTSNPRSRLAGSVRTEDGRAAVRIEDHFATDVADLWTAVTDPVRLARWVAEVTGDLRPGGEVRARFTSGWEGNGRVEVCDPPYRLLVAMTEDESADETVIEATLTPVEDGTRLVVEERGLPLGQGAAYGAGWQVHVEDLGAYLAGRATSDWAARWAELAPAYRDREVDPG